MNKKQLIKQLRDMAKHPTVTLPRDTDALKGAADLLEQAEKQEPVGYMNAGYLHEMQKGRLPYTYIYPKEGVGCHVALYTSPPPQQAEQAQPVGQLQEEAYGRGQVMWFSKPADQTMLYTAPPPRQPLTDEEIRKAFYDSDEGQETQEYIIAFARAIEAAHGIKGEA